MNVKPSIKIALFILSLIATSFCPAPTFAQSEKKVAFYCGRTQDGNLHPATMIGVNTKGQEPWTIMVWKNTVANSTPKQRCETTSARFQKAWDRKEFNHLISGLDRRNGRGLICAVKAKQDSCNSTNMLFALNNYQNAEAVIQGLKDSIRKTGNPQYQSSSNDSIDMQELVDAIMQPTK